MIGLEKYDSPGENIAKLIHFTSHSQKLREHLDVQS